MDAILLFSGGKDSLMAFRKSQENGYNVVAGFSYQFADSVMVAQPVLNKIAENAGIPNLTTYSFTESQIAATPLPISLTEQLRNLLITYPNAKTLILGADVFQSFVMFLFYIRIAHAAGMSLYIPYSDCFSTEFYNDMRRYNLEIRLVKFTPQSNPPAYEKNNVLPISMFEEAYSNKNLPLASETQTIVTNGNFFSSPVHTTVDANGVIQLQ